MPRAPVLLVALCLLAPAAVPAQPVARGGTGTPPRLAVVEGPVSFLRPGGGAWTAAKANTPLAAGDALWVASGGSVEAQIGPRSFLRLAGETYVELSDLAADQLQLKLSGGDAALDLGEPALQFAVEVNAPHSAFLVERPGSYRLHADERASTIITRRGGAATAAPGEAPPVPILPSEEAVVTPEGAVHRFPAPEPDAWDRWGRERTERLVDPRSLRHVPLGVYGVEDLDRAGTWQETPEYGAVWMPAAIPLGWSPFATGAWIYDGTFGWTWVDDAAWGWAPFHHGRWVSTPAGWGWAPGPPGVIPAYAPATVGWLEGGEGVAWVPLGWGEPLFPWWGSPGFSGTAWWGGWGGPWVVNGAPVSQRVTVYAGTLTYANTRAPVAVVTAPETQFGRGGGTYLRALPQEVALLRPQAEGPGVRPVAASLAPTTERTAAPPKDVAVRRVVATRMPPDAAARYRALGLKTSGTPVIQLVLPPARTPPATGDRPPPAPRDAGAEEAADDDDRDRARALRTPRLDGFAAPPPPVAMRPNPEFDAPAALAMRTVTTTSTLAPVAPPAEEPLPTTTSTWAPVPTTAPEMPLPTTTSTTVPAAALAEPAVTCAAAGDRCGPCGGRMSRCWPLIEGGAFVCPNYASCFTVKCVKDADCEPGQRCVLNQNNFQTNCCQVCDGAPPALGTTTTWPPLPPTTTTTTWPPLEPTTTTWPPLTPTTSTWPLGTTTTTTLPAVLGDERPFRGCEAAVAGDRCGPCGGRMSRCWPLIEGGALVCPNYASCFTVKCVKDADCEPGQRCVLNQNNFQTNCCRTCPE